MQLRTVWRSGGGSAEALLASICRRARALQTPPASARLVSCSRVPSARCTRRIDATEAAQERAELENDVLVELEKRAQPTRRRDETRRDETRRDEQTLEGEFVRVGDRSERYEVSAKQLTASARVRRASERPAGRTPSELARRRQGHGRPVRSGPVPSYPRVIEWRCLAQSTPADSTLNAPTARLTRTN